jgi:hypothetical protein
MTFDMDLEYSGENNFYDVIDAFGHRVGNLLIENGFDNLDLVRDATDDALLAISGIGTSTLVQIRAVLDEAGVTERPATADSVVKPDSMEAEAVEVGIADLASTDEADLAGSGVVVIRSLWPSVLRLTAPSGLTYQWNGGGDQVNVLATDIEFVMGKNRNVGRACCGASSERIYFEMA